MKHLARVTLIAVALLLLTPSFVRPVSAQDDDDDERGRRKATTTISIPVTGSVDDNNASGVVNFNAAGNGGFTGTFKLKRFRVTNAAVVAEGLLTGTLRTADGRSASLVRNLAIPFSPAVPEPLSPAAGIAQVTCDIVLLELGPLDLDLLGLVVHLDKIVLDLDAQSGPGNLLGNLLCALTGLLDNPAANPNAVAALLNAILGIIG